MVYQTKVLDISTRKSKVHITCLTYPMPSDCRYQGYVCPGILIVIASHSNLETVVGAWRRRLLSSPPGVGPITQVGISNGCMVKPVTQAHHVALHDAICLTLAR